MEDNKESANDGGVAGPPARADAIGVDGNFIPTRAVVQASSKGMDLLGSKAKMVFDTCQSKANSILEAFQTTNITQLKAPTFTAAGQKPPKRHIAIIGAIVAVAVMATLVVSTTSGSIPPPLPANTKIDSSNSSVDSSSNNKNNTFYTPSSLTDRVESNELRSLRALQAEASGAAREEQARFENDYDLAVRPHLLKRMTTDIFFSLANST